MANQSSPQKIGDILVKFNSLEDNVFLGNFRHKEDLTSHQISI